MQSSIYWSSGQRSNGPEQKCHFVRGLVVPQHNYYSTSLNLFVKVPGPAFLSLSDSPAVSMKSCLSRDSSDQQHKASSCPVISGKVFTSGYCLIPFVNGHLALGDTFK